MELGNGGEDCAALGFSMVDNETKMNYISVLNEWQELNALDDFPIISNIENSSLDI